MMTNINVNQGIIIRLYRGNNVLKQHNVVQFSPRMTVNKAGGPAQLGTDGGDSFFRRYSIINTNILYGLILIFVFIMP